MAKLFLILLLISSVFAQDLGFPSQQLPPTINCGENFFACLAFFFEKILKIILVLALVLSTIFIAWAGISYITKGGGREEEIKKIHKMLVWAIIGFVVAFLSFAFVQALEFWIRNLEEESSYFFNFALAQIQEPSPPESLRCDSVSLPSVFQRSDLSQDVWKVCILFYVQRILSFLYVLALMLGVIFLAWAGILYITQPAKSSEIHKRLIYGVLGIVLAILSFTIVKIINLFFFNL
jgi:TRAP-type C4-dicarboxylate transport system permease small subunit